MKGYSSDDTASAALSVDVFTVTRVVNVRASDSTALSNALRYLLTSLALARVSSCARMAGRSDSAGFTSRTCERTTKHTCSGTCQSEVYSKSMNAAAAACGHAVTLKHGSTRSMLAAYTSRRGCDITAPLPVSSHLRLRG